MHSKSLSAKGMAQHNRDLILNLLREKGTLSRNEIRAQIGTSPATTNRLTISLLERGALIDEGPAPSTGGRPSMQLRFNERAGVIVSIDVGSQALRGGIVDLRGNIVHSEEIPSLGMGPRERLVQLQELVKSLLRRYSKTEHCLAVAVGVPGIVDSEGKVSWAPALGWHEVALSRAISEHTSLPVFIENDANTLAVAEDRYGEAKGAEVLLAVILGNGIGAGIISDGRLYRGHTRSAGEVGYLLTSTDSLTKTYDGFGDLESRVGAEAITAKSREIGLTTSSGADLTVEEVFNLARSGNPAASELLEEIVDDLAIAIANLAAVLDPAVVVLGGGIAASADVIIPRLTERLKGRIPQTPQLLPPSLGQTGVLIGAAELAIDGIGSLDRALGATSVD